MDSLLALCPFFAGFVPKRYGCTGQAPFRILEQTPDFHPCIEGRRPERLLQGFSCPDDRERKDMARRRLDRPDSPGQPQHRIVLAPSNAYNMPGRFLLVSNSIPLSSDQNLTKPYIAAVIIGHENLKKPQIETAIFGHQNVTKVNIQTTVSEAMVQNSPF